MWVQVSVQCCRWGQVPEDLDIAAMCANMLRELLPQSLFGLGPEYTPLGYRHIYKITRTEDQRGWVTGAHIRVLTGAGICEPVLGHSGWEGWTYNRFMQDHLGRSHGVIHQVGDAQGVRIRGLSQH